MDILRSLRRKAQPKTYGPFDLDRPLLHFAQHDPWRIRDACEGTQVFGATGSGKTSGSGQAIAKAFLQGGFGGLVLTAKPDERATWERYCFETGRSDDLVIFSPEGPHRFNFLDYEVNRPGAGAGLTENLVRLFSTVMEVSGGSGGQDGRANAGFWEDTKKQLLRNAIDLVTIATGRLSLHDIYRVITTAPQSNDELHNDAWLESSFCAQCVTQGHEREKTPSRQQDFDLTASYWYGDFPNLADRTRSVIVASFTGMADAFLRGVLRELFSTTTTITPEDTHQGKIILVDLNLKEFDAIGRYAQVLFKYLWQRATERRDVAQSARPVFLWADESQFFVTSHDMLFQTTARSAKACTVYLTQNLPNYYAVLKGEGGRHQVDSLLGNLQTKIFHANGDAITNEWAASVIGRRWQFRGNVNVAHDNNGTPFLEGDHKRNYSAGGSQMMEYEILPTEFTTLRKGGPDNDLTVDGIVFQGGRVFEATGKNYIEVSFGQDE